MAIEAGLFRLQELDYGARAGVDPVIQDDFVAMGTFGRNGYTTGLPQAPMLKIALASDAKSTNRPTCGV